MVETEKMTLKEERKMLLASIKLENQLEERFREIVRQKVKIRLDGKKIFHLEYEEICYVKVLQKKLNDCTDIEMDNYDVPTEYHVYDERDNFEDVHKFIDNVKLGGYTVEGGKISEDEEKTDYLGRKILEEYFISF